jgi:hypothetical protein
VPLPLGAVFGAAGHHDFQRLSVQLGPELDQRIEKIHADAAAHADDHRLAVHRLHALLEMRHQVGGDERDALWIVDQCLQRSPFGFELLLLCQLLALGDFLKLRVQLWQLGGIQGELGDAAFVIDWLRRLIRHGALNIVDGNIIAEHRPRIGISFLDGCAGKANERRLRQGITQVAGKPVGHLTFVIRPPSKAVLRPVRFVCDHYNVAAIRKGFHPTGWRNITL